MCLYHVSELGTLAAGLDHPEGIALGPDGHLYAGGEAGQVYRIDLHGGWEQIANTSGLALGICLDANNCIYVCDGRNRAVMRVDGATGMVDRWCDSANRMPLTMPNWGAFASDGSMWLSDSGTEDVPIQDGRLLRVPADGGDADVIELEPLHFPNGLCLGPDGTVYWLESFTPRLRRLGEAGPELVADLSGVVPDGVALDRDGGFLIACYYPFRLLRIPPDAGEIELLLDDTAGIYAPMPTNVAYFGEGLSQLAIACLGGYEVKSLPAPVPGVSLIYP